MSEIISEYYKRKADEAKKQKQSQDHSDYIDSIIGAVGIPCETMDVRAFYLEQALADFKAAYGLELNPDFQRDHVWTKEQKVAYVQNLIRGAIGTSGKLISFNCSSYSVKKTGEGSDIPNMVCIDGLQRLTAVREFIKGDFKVFPQLDPENGGVSASFFDNTRRGLNRVTNGLQFQIFDMQSKKDVLEYYIALNYAGTSHSVSEIERVMKMHMEL